MAVRREAGEGERAERARRLREGGLDVLPNLCRRQRVASATTVQDGRQPSKMEHGNWCCSPPSIGISNVPQVHSSPQTHDFIILEKVALAWSWFSLCTTRVAQRRLRRQLSPGFRLTVADTSWVGEIERETNRESKAHCGRRCRRRAGWALGIAPSC